MVFLVILTLLSIALVTISWPKSSRISREGAPIRYAPNGLPLLGHSIQFLRDRHHLLEWFSQVQRRYGFETLRISIPTLPPGVIIHDPVNIEFVLKNEQLVGKGHFTRTRLDSLFKRGIINANGALWSAQRKAGAKFFSGAQLEMMVDQILPEAMRRLRAKLVTYAESGAIIDMQDIFLDYTSFVMGHMAYDIELDSSSAFSKAFDFASDCIGRRFQNPLYPVTELFNSKLHTSLAEVRSFGRKIVAKAKRTRSRAAFDSLIDNSAVTFDNTLVNQLIESLGDENLVAEASLNFLSAGKDTTAQALTWTLFLLLRNPGCLKPLQKEVLSLPKQSKAEDSTESFHATTIGDLQPSSIPWLMATLYEALRLYPPIPIEIQETHTDLTLPDGTFLPQKSVIVYSIWAINRARQIYGDDADLFRPERWLANGKLLVRSSSEFPVFNGGPRMCLGKKMAELMATFCLANLQDFTFELTSPLDERDPRPQNSLTLPMNGGLPCRVRRRGE